MASAFLCGTAIHASVIYDESVSGDLSNSGLTPMLLTVSLGSNELFGTTGKTMAIDRDYFTFTVPNGLVLSGITLLPGTQTLGPLGDSFIGVETGPQVTVATSAKTAAGLLGWDHYDAGDIGTDILPAMGSAGLGANGFHRSPALRNLLVLGSRGKYRHSSVRVGLHDRNAGAGLVGNSSGGHGTVGSPHGPQKSKGLNRNFWKCFDLAHEESMRAQGMYS